MAVQLDNLDSVLAGLAKLENAAGTEVLREARKLMRATIRKDIPKYKKLVKDHTEKRSGDLIKSIKIKSRSRRGLSNVKLIFTVPYAGYLNFTEGYKTNSFASDQYNSDKDILEQQGLNDVKKSFSTIFDKYGVKYK